MTTPIRKYIPPPKPIDSNLLRKKQIGAEPVPLRPSTLNNAAVYEKKINLQLSGSIKRTQLERNFEQGSSIIGNTAKGVAVDKMLPRRYGLEPPRGDTVTGIRNNSAGKVRGTPPRPVGDWLVRFDRADKRTTYPHINLNPKLTGVPDPHTQISPATLKTLGSGARVFESLSKVARPLALVSDALRLGSAFNSDGNQIGRNTEITAGSVAGGWAGAAVGGLAGAEGGAAVGAAVGVFFGGVGAVPGAAIGGFVGGLVGSIAGAFGGSAVGEQAATAIVDSGR